MKMELDVVRLHFTTPLHISNVRGDYNTTETLIHSDTLYAAIMQAWADLGKSEWIQSESDYCLSSLFPFTSCNNRVIYFFKKPYQYKREKERSSELMPGDAKKFKKVKYFDKDFFGQTLNGTLNPTIKEVKGDYLTKESINPQFISSHVIPRIRWQRNEIDDTEIFYMERLYFAGGSGMYFIVQADEEWKKRLMIAINYLSESGLGTDRAVGNGRFTFETDRIELDVPEQAQYSVNLSLFCPNSQTELEQLVGDNCGYEFIKRGGWLGEPNNTYRKRSIYMFSEGSVFKKSINSIDSMGKTVDLTPLNTPRKIENPVYRVGKSLFIPIKV